MIWECQQKTNNEESTDDTSFVTASLLWYGALELVRCTMVSPLIDQLLFSLTAPQEGGVIELFSCPRPHFCIFPQNVENGFSTECGKF